MKEQDTLKVGDQVHWKYQGEYEGKIIAVIPSGMTFDKVYSELIQNKESYVNPHWKNSMSSREKVSYVVELIRGPNKKKGLYIPTVHLYLKETALTR